MAKREHCGIYQQRFNKLWAALSLCDAKSAGELSASLVSGVIGCSEDYAGRMIAQRVRQFK